MKTRKAKVGGLFSFMNYYGGKAQVADLYPKPQYRTIIEPFAGGAGYSLRYHYLDIVLVEKFPLVADIWRYLISADPERILRLPLKEEIPEQGIKSMKWLQRCEKALVGYWLGIGGGGKPHNKPTQWCSWDAGVRARIARQVEKIRHWKIIEGDYRDAPDVEAVWFIDPPYQEKGYCYPCSSEEINFRSLGKWCRSRQGQVIVCEQEGADWLPFRPFYRIESMTHKLGGAKKADKIGSQEVVWLSEGQKYPRIETREGFGL